MKTHSVISWREHCYISRTRASTPRSTYSPFQSTGSLHKHGSIWLRQEYEALALPAREAPGDEIMRVTTTQNIPGYEVETLEIVFGNTVRAKHVGKDIMSGLKSIVGGELRGYSEMLADARAEAMSRMVDDAKRLDADAVVNVRFTTSQTMAGAAELLAYGTAVKLRKL